MTTEQRFDPAQFLRATGDAIIAADGNESIIFWNAAAERIFGHAEAEALGHPLALIIPDRLRARHSEGYSHVMKTGVSRYGSDLLRVPALHKDGRPLSIAFTVALMRAADDASWIIAATIRDDTARWQEERAMRKHIAELEAKLRPQ